MIETKKIPSWRNSIITLAATALCFSFFACNSVSADKSCDDPCGKPTPWNDFNVFSLKVTQPSQNGFSLWHGQADENSMDMRIDAKTSDGKLTKNGTILMIGGRVMATKGDVTTPGYEIDALDAAVLGQMLVYRLLGASIPEGPVHITGEQKIDFSSQKTGIQFATQSAQGFISAPWNVKGFVKLIAPNVIEYELRLTAFMKAKPTGENTTYISDFSGSLSKTAHARLDDKLSLEGWKIYGVGVQSKKMGKLNTMDYSTAPTPAVYKTIADIREKIAADK